MLHIRPILSSNPISLLQGDDFRGRSCSAKGAHLNSEIHAHVKAFGKAVQIPRDLVT